MVPFSEFVAYGDESGTATLGKIEADFPAVGLAFCVFRVEDYVREVVPQVQTLKFRYFGHDQVVLHESEIRRRQGDFIFGSSDLRAAFMAEINALMREIPMAIVATVVDQQALRRRYGSAFDAYDVGLRCCAEQVLRLIGETDPLGAEAEVSVVAEARSSTTQNHAAENRFYTGLPGIGTYASAPPSRVKLRFARKQANSTGLQIADLVVRPIVLQVLRPDQPNRAWDAVAPKLYDGGSSLTDDPDLKGIIVVPRHQSAPGEAGAL